MFYVIVTVHFVLSFVMVGLVLLQQGKGADMGPAFGGGGSNSLFGTAGAAPFIVKLTTVVCILFMATSILLIKNYDKYTDSRVVTTDVLSGSVLGGAAAPAESVPAPFGSSTTGGNDDPAPVQAGAVAQPVVPSESSR